MPARRASAAPDTNHGALSTATRASFLETHAKPAICRPDGDQVIVARWTESDDVTILSNTPPRRFPVPCSKWKCNLVSRLSSVLASILLLLGVSVSSAAQDLYDTNVLRSFNITFHDVDWMARLRANYVSETLILADLEVDGVTYPDVGVRIRGNTSYTALPAGSEKFSLKIKMDHVHGNQELMSYDTINLNNGWRDPTFTREVVYNNFVAQFIPNPRASHVLVTLNGENWGVYINVQQTDKRMLRDYFSNADGLRIRCANNPNGPGLAYNGPGPGGYGGYEFQTDGGLADPLAALIAVTFALSNEPLATMSSVDALFAIDPSIWSVVLENLLTDDDSYVNKGCDFMTYRDPIDGRMHLFQRDANETFAQPTWAITRNFTASNKPVLSRVLAVPAFRQRFFAHYRTARMFLNWDHFGPIFAAHRALIETHVQADPKKLYSYALFQTNFTSSVTMPLPGLAGGTIPGLQQFIDQRGAFLNGSTELSASGPDILAVAASVDTPNAGEPVWITASILPDGSPILAVDLYYRPSADAGYLSVPMLDDGTSGDGAAGDGVYGALLPVPGVSGQRVSYYVGASSDNAHQSLSFSPPLAERGPLLLEYAIGDVPGMRITEWMYSGGDGEFIEFTNLSDASIDLAGWSMDDDHGVPGAFDISAFGVVQPGEAVIVTENDAEIFRTAWGLPIDVKILGNLGNPDGNNLGRNDQIYLYNKLGGVEDQLFYGDQTFPGSIRTQNRSGQADCVVIGQNTVADWQLSELGDAFGTFASAAGDLGTPGSFDSEGCIPTSEVIFADGFE